MVGKITFKINAEGEVSMDVNGVTGNACETMTRPFEEAIGIVSKKEYKDTFYLDSQIETQEGIQNETP